MRVSNVNTATLAGCAALPRKSHKLFGANWVTFNSFRLEGSSHLSTGPNRLQDPALTPGFFLRGRRAISFSLLQSVPKHPILIHAAILWGREA